MFVVFYTVNLNICVFMTCSTSYCLYDTQTYPWNVKIYVRMCMYLEPKILKIELWLKLYLITVH